MRALLHLRATSRLAQAVTTPDGSTTVVQLGMRTTVRVVAPRSESGL